MAPQKNFHKIFTFERVRRFFQVPVIALPISDYARARFFAQRNRVTFDDFPQTHSRDHRQWFRN
jgi:hypothetical protein